MQRQRRRSWAPLAAVGLGLLALLYIWAALGTRAPPDSAPPPPLVAPKPPAAAGSPLAPAHSRPPVKASAPAKALKSPVTAAPVTNCTRLSQGKCGPAFIVIGAMKSGTSSLYEYLVLQHELVMAASRKELHYFTRNFARGPDWYESQLPTAELPFVTGEASPTYFVHPDVPRRIKELLPAVRLVLLLREPVARFVSHYNYINSFSRDALVQRSIEQVFAEQRAELDDCRSAGRSYADCVAAAIERPSDYYFHHSHLFRGMYAEQVRWWRRYFGPDQLLIVQAERLFGDTEATFRRIVAFLGLPADGIVEPLKFRVINKGPRSTQPPEQLRDELQRFYEPWNEQLFELIGERFDW